MTNYGGPWWPDKAITMGGPSGTTREARLRPWGFRLDDRMQHQYGMQNVSSEGCLLIDAPNISKQTGF